MPFRIKFRIFIIYASIALLLAAMLIAAIMANSTAARALILSAATIFCFATIKISYILIPHWDGFLKINKKRLSKNRIAALTFDDGPDEPWTGEILDILNENKVRATFFVLGTKAASSPAIIKRMRDDGHEIGNHAISHRKMIFMRKDEIRDEIERTNAIIEGITGRIPKLFRAPHGFKTQRLLRILKEFQMTLIPWTKGLWDTDGSSGDKIFKRFTDSFCNFEILLLHDGVDRSLTLKDRSATVAALPRIIAEYRRLGYQFKTISELEAQ